MQNYIFYVFSMLKRIKRINANVFSMLKRINLEVSQTAVWKTTVGMCTCEILREDAQIEGLFFVYLC